MNDSDLVSKRIREYHQDNPREEFPNPDIMVVTKLREKVIKTYRDFGYPVEYINDIDKNRASWKTTVAVTIMNKTMGFPSKVIISEPLWRRDTIYHELTHVSDYYGYCLRHNYTDMTYMEFLDLEDFQSVYLMSEFKAFYRCALKGFEDIAKRVEHERANYERKLQQAVKAQQLEKCFYHNVSFVGYLCAFYELNAPSMIYQLPDDTKNNTHVLLKFLYGLRKKPFEELEQHFGDLKTILDGFVDNI